MLRTITMTAVILLLGITLVHDATAQVSWAVAKRQRAEIQSFVERLLPRAEDTPGAMEAPVVILYKQSYFDVKAGGYQLCRNLVFRVNDADGMTDDLLAPYVDVLGQVTDSAAFRVRQKNFVRLMDEEIEVTPGDGMIRRAQVHFPIPGVQDGDIIGWSVITSFEEPLYVARVAAADRYPVSYSSIRVQVDRSTGMSSQAYTIRGQGLTEPLEVDATNVVQYRPSVWTARLSNLAAIPDLPSVPFYAPDVPVFLVVNTETYVQIPGIMKGWARSTGWGRTALLLSRFKEDRLRVTSTRLDDLVDSVVASATSDAEKETAIFEYVRDHFGRIEGDVYDQRFFRRSVDVVLDAETLTDFEKVALMTLMLKEADLTGEICAVHKEAYGPLDDTLRSYHQFQALGVRCGDDDPRFYAPFVSGAPAGRFPVEWGRCDVLSPTPGLVRQAENFNLVINQRLESSDPATDSPEKVKKEVEEYVEQRGWFRLETVEP